MIYIYNIIWHNTFIIKMLLTEIDALIKKLGIGLIPWKANWGMPSKEGFIWRDCIPYQSDLRQFPTKYVLCSETT